MSTQPKLRSAGLRPGSAPMASFHRAGPEAGAPGHGKTLERRIPIRREPVANLYRAELEFGAPGAEKREFPTVID